jgi:hypothetical protein
MAIANSRTKKGLGPFFDQLYVGFASNLSLNFDLPGDQNGQWEAGRERIADNNCYLRT